jgi:hypothetical protein
VDLIEPPPRRSRRLPALVPAVGLALLAAGQAATLLQAPALPRDLELVVTKENYGFFPSDRGTVAVGFQVRNDGSRAVRVSAVDAAVPGLALVDVTGAGEPFGFRSTGEGGAPLPTFELAPGAVVVLTLAYDLVSCTKVPDDVRPVRLTLTDGRSEGVAAVPLPPLPDDAEDASAEDVVQWQTVVVRDLCG